MKRILLYVAALLLSVSATAGVVSKSQAESVARNILGATSVKYVWNGLGDLKYGDVNPAYYVFNSGTAWAVISADDCATPVLMHGKGTFNPNDLPDNMRSLLGEIENNIFTARNRKLAQAPEIKQAWSTYAAMTRADVPAPVEKLVVDQDGNSGTALWNQSRPYNSKCPSASSGGSGGHCYAGCVASAMAIIMRFHQWPAAGTGTLASYTTESYDYSIPQLNIQGYEYNWADLPRTDAYSDSYSSNPWSQTQLDKVADILYHCGVMVEMDYGPSGSGASTSVVASAMASHMSYSSSATELYRSDYTNQQWFNMIKKEINANHPLLYSGQNLYANSGHAFVCDGYNSNNQIHINWGWGGSYNAWFAVCYLGEVGGEGTAVYSRSDSAIFGLVPATGIQPAGGETVPEIVVNANYPGGISLVSGTVAKGSSFTLNLSSAWNIGENYSGTLMAALLDKSGNIREFISSGQTVSIDHTYIKVNKQFACCITKDIAIGDYISIMCSYGDEKWAPVGKYWADTSNPVTKYYPIDITLMDIPSSFTVGQICYPGLISAQVSVSSVIWYLDNTKLTKDYVAMTSGKHTFKAVITYSDNSTETIVKKVTVE